MRGTERNSVILRTVTCICIVPAHASMPGMMDTILNPVLNDVCKEGFAKKTGNWRFAYDLNRKIVFLTSLWKFRSPTSRRSSTK